MATMVAVDIGAQSGRVAVGRLDGERLSVEEVHRFPNVPLADADRVSEVGDLLFERGLYLTMCPYPIVPRREAGFRIQVTAANGEEHIDRLVDALHELQDLFRRRDESPVRPRRFVRTR